jgi:hypothetical protein
MRERRAEKGEPCVISRINIFRDNFMRRPFITSGKVLSVLMLLFCLTAEGKADLGKEFNKIMKKGLSDVLNPETKSDTKSNTRTRQKPTRERPDSFDFKSLPLEQAVKRVNGNGQRIIKRNNLLNSTARQ